MRALLVFTVACCACAPDLRTDHPFDGQTTDGPLVVAEATDGGTILHVDATNKLSQVYVDLDEGRELKPEEAFATNGWELAFKRYEVGVNSGASNPDGVVTGRVLVNQDWAALTVAPADGYVVDPPEHLFNGPEGGWYYYDLGVHRLVTKPELSYVVKTGAGAYFKVRMLDYYDATGTPAALSLEYAALSPP